DVECTPNPARTHTTFRIVHDRINAEMSVRLDVFDTSGRHLWSHTENGVSSDNTYTINWDLTVDGGRRLHTGLYLYRLSIGVDGSTYASKTNKLIIFTHQ
ncbi:MAG: T9SS type A sorting domain-containing protein, partial [Prevotella sp.]|nr:T9SS type A sorting domain-containing protein [Prevotella sp.]